MPDICSASNLTLVSLDARLEYLISVKPKEKRIVGLYGKCLDSMMDELKNRKCDLVEEEFFGVKLDNGTYTGALGLLQSGKAHVYLKGEPNFIDEDWLERSLPLRTENIWAGQVIEDGNKFDYFDLLQNFKFSLELYLIYFLAFQIFGLSCFYLIRSDLSANRNYLQRTNASKFVYFISYLFISRKFKFKLILLFLGLFSWFTILFLTNTIKTNKVMVDTSELIKNNDELMKSDLVCFFKDDTAYNLALNSPKKSLLFRLIDKKTKFKHNQHRNEKSILKSKKCIVQRNPANLKIIKKNIILIMTQIEAMALMIVFSEINQIKKAFLLKRGIQEYNAVMYYAKYKTNYNLNLDSKEYNQLIIGYSYALNEYGGSIRMYDCMESNAQLVFRKTIKVYEELYEYIEDNTGSFADLELNNFLPLFFIYFTFSIFILIIFFIFQIVPFYRSKLIDIINDKYL